MPSINTINDFAAAVQTALTAAFPECRIEAVNVTKNNSVHLTGLAIHPQNKKIAPAVYMEPYFSALQSGQPLETVVSQIISTCTAALSCAEIGIDAEAVTDFTQVRDKICYKLISKNKNSRLLSEAPHRDYHDLAVAYYIQLARTDNGHATVTVSDSLAKIWGIDEETLYSLAQNNTPRINRGCIMPIKEVLGIPSSGSGGGLHKPDTYDGFDFTSITGDEPPMYIATNQNKTYGAGILLYDGLLDAVAEKLGNFYVLPSSVHELIIVPEKFGHPSELKQMVEEINGTEVPAEEILSDSCYCFDADTHELKIAV